MTVLLKVWQGKKLLGQCDAKCYNSKSETCRCVCHGNHHGKGHNKSVNLIRSNKFNWRIAYPEIDGYKVKMF